MEEQRTNGKTKRTIAIFGLLGTAVSAAAGAYISRSQSATDQERDSRMLTHLQSTVAAQQVQLKEAYRLLAHEVTSQGRLLARQGADIATLKQIILPVVGVGGFPKSPPHPPPKHKTLPPTLRKPSKDDVIAAQRALFWGETTSF